jgi:hypothetical protein
MTELIREPASFEQLWYDWVAEEEADVITGDVENISSHLTKTSSYFIRTDILLFRPTFILETAAKLSRIDIIILI